MQYEEFKDQYHASNLIRFFDRDIKGSDPGDWVLTLMCNNFAVEWRKRMRYGLIGCGRISANHIEAALNNKLEIVAVCDIVKERAEKLRNIAKLPKS